MILTMLVDLDHLWANPVYDPNRCSIGFHPLHQLFPIGMYILLSLSPYFFREPFFDWHTKYRQQIKLKVKLVQYIGLGLIVHMILDSIDCRINTGSWLNIN